MTPITTPTDLLKTPPMHTVVRKYGRQEVIGRIIKALSKCAGSLGIDAPPQQLKIIADDVFEVYKSDSLEDVIECLKKARRGFYGFGHNSRSSINMILISEWMSKHLEEKAIAREKELAKFKKKDDQEVKGIDYEAYKKRIRESKSQKETNAIENEYQRFRNEYLNHKPQPKQKAK